jgi:acetoacetyl-CoA synthetase
MNLSPGDVLFFYTTTGWMMWKAEIRTRLRGEYTPRHVPDKLIQVPEIPTTLTGKKLEVPVRRLLMGIPLARAVNTSAMADPSALDAILEYARTQDDYKL